MPDATLNTVRPLVPYPMNADKRRAILGSNSDSFALSIQNSVWKTMRTLPRLRQYLSPTCAMLPKTLVDALQPTVFGGVRCTARGRAS